MIWALAVLAVLAVGVVTAPWLAEWLRRPMDNRARALAPGQFAELSQGLTHFQWHGPSRGPVIVCVHGLTTPGFVWLPVAAGLTMLGYRVLTYDLYGRGYSDRPGGRQDAGFFVRQLDDLLVFADAGSNLTLVGYSMGGAIAADYAVAHPERVIRLVLLASSGLGQAPSRLLDFARAVPLLGDVVLVCFGGWVAQSWARVPTPPIPTLPELHEQLIGESRLRGYFPAVLSSMRHYLAEPKAAAHAALAASGLPVLAIWGEQDAVIPLTALGQLSQINRKVRQVTIPGAGHSLPLTHAREVIAAIQGVLREGGV